MNTNPFGETTDKVIMNPGYQNARVDKSAGPVDPEVSVLSLKTKEGKHIALLANYSLHYVGGFLPSVLITLAPSLNPSALF